MAGLWTTSIRVWRAVWASSRHALDTEAQRQISLGHRLGGMIANRAAPEAFRRSGGKPDTDSPFFLPHNKS